MKLFTVLAAAAIATATAQSHPAEHDFACGAEIEAFCGDSKDVMTCLKEHRHELERECLDKLLEHESLACGFEVALDCGADRHDHEKFRECLHEHYEQLKKICPEITNFDRYDEIANIKCGAEIEECCAKTSDDCKHLPSKSKCINYLEHATKECFVAITEEKDFLCGIETERACGKDAGHPLAFIECIEEKQPCKHFD